MMDDLVPGGGDHIQRGRLETVDTPRKEPVTIIIDELDHWPEELGALTPEEKKRLAVWAEQRLWEKAEGLFEKTTFLDSWPPVTGSLNAADLFPEARNNGS